MPMHKIVESKRGKPILILDGFVYNKDGAECGGSIRWRCTERLCKGSLYTNTSYVVLRHKPHNHEADHKECAKVATLKSIYTRSIHTSENINDLIAFETKKLNEQEILSLPKLNYIKDVVIRKRNASIGFIKNEYDDIPEILRNTLNGKKFMQFDSGVCDPERFVIFYSEESYCFIKYAKIWLVDGTFKSCPSSFQQLYTIHGFLYGKCYPPVYVLSLSKTKSNYIRIFKQLNLKCDESPEIIISDFEIAVFEAAQIVFPNVDCSGCIFHFGQAV